MSAVTDFVIKVKSLFEGKSEMNQASASVADVGDQGADAARKFRELERASESAANATSDLGSKQQSTNSALSEVSGTIAKVTAAAAALKGTYDLLTSAVQAYAEKEQAVAGLDASLAARGQLTAEYRKELQELAGQLQATTAIGDDAWYGVFQKLTQFGADRTNIGGYTEAVKNLAGFLGGDLHGAAALFGRAMEGNFDMLSRYGITVDKSASQTEKLNQLMEQLAVRGGGVLEARARTLSGSFDQMNNVVGDLMASLGQMINQNGGINTFLQNWISGVEQINAALGDTIPQVDGLRNAVVLQGLSAEEASRLNNEYAEAIKATEVASQEAEENLRTSIATAERSAKSTADMARAERDLALARISADETLSDSEKLTKRAEIEEAFRNSTLTGEQELAKQTVALREAAAAEAEARAASIREKANQAALAAEAANAKSAASVRSAEEIAEAERTLQQLAAAREAQERKLGTMTRGFLNPEVYDAEETRLRSLEKSVEQARAALDVLKDPDTEAMAAAEAAQMRADALAAQADEAERAAKAARERADSENEVTTELIEQKTALAEISAETARTNENAAIAAAEARAATEAQRREAEEIARANREAAAAKREEEAATRAILDLEKRGGRRVTGTDGRVLRDADGNLADGVQKSGLGTLHRPVGSMLNRPEAPSSPPEAAPRSPSPENGNSSTSPLTDPAKVFSDVSEKNERGSAKMAQNLEALSSAISASGQQTASALSQFNSLLEKTLHAAEQHGKKIEKITTDLGNLGRRVDNLRV